MKYVLIVLAALLISVAGYSQGFYSLNYTMSSPVGETGKYINKTSFRGFTFEGRRFISDNISLGGVFTWSTFYEKVTDEPLLEDNMTISGTQYRYLNVFPILFQAHYYLSTEDKKQLIYMGGGAGVYKINQRTELGVWLLEHNNWHFGISPEIGLFYPVSNSASLNISLKYHYVFKTSETTDHSWFGLNVGIAFGS